MKEFNTTGLCIPEKHYMVDTSKKIDQIIDEYISKGKYFVINRARQFGKTTTLYLLQQRLVMDYAVCSLSFEAKDSYFVSEDAFVNGIIRDITKWLVKINVSDEIIKQWNDLDDEHAAMTILGEHISTLCKLLDKDIILIIDEVDKSSDNQIFMTFLGMLRDKYLLRERGEDYTFKSVILAGVYDIKNLKLKLRPDEERKYNSPWNIADEFTVDMSFDKDEIVTMLSDYERNHNTGMDVDYVAEEIESYTEGYPYLVSRMCKKLDEIGAWSHDAILESVKCMVDEKSTLMDDIAKNLRQYPDLKKMIYEILFVGKYIPFHIEEEIISIGIMFGFLKNDNGKVAVANRIFEIWFYNLFIAEDARNSDMYDVGLIARERFVEDAIQQGKDVRGTPGVLNMEAVLRKFMEYYTELYHDSTDKFVEENGRRLFLLFLKPIINGTGNYYVESRTRSMGRTDVIVDYLGKQYVIEMKIWRGNEYNERGERQLEGYLDDYNLKRGYMISFNFNKNKKVEMKELHFKDKTLIEVVV